MLSKLNFRLAKVHPALMTVAWLLTLGCIGLLEYCTGYEISFSIFYLGPVLAAVWFTGRVPGAILCVASARVSLLVDQMSGRVFSHDFIPFWNAIVRLCFFAVSMPDTDLAGAETAFRKIFGRLSDIAREHRWPIGFSIGVAVFSGASCGVDNAVKSADKIMYKVKQSGKNRVMVERAFGTPP